MWYKILNKLKKQVHFLEKLRKLMIIATTSIKTIKRGFRDSFALKKQGSETKHRLPNELS